MRSICSLLFTCVLLAVLIGCGSPPTPGAEIAGITCLEGQAMDVHVQIINPQGIQSYAMWSIWGGGGDIEKTFDQPYPTKVDEVVRFEHFATDADPSRAHQLGLVVVIPGQADSIFAYAVEPGDRCPEH